jgi:hypothetical protein
LIVRWDLACSTLAFIGFDKNTDESDKGTIATSNSAPAINAADGDPHAASSRRTRRRCAASRCLVNGDRAFPPLTIAAKPTPGSLGVSPMDPFKAAGGFWNQMRMVSVHQTGLMYGRAGSIVPEPPPP